MLEDLDPSSPVPLYVQIVEQVRRLVALGALRPGDRFLTVRELAVRARVNRNTAARAIQALERAGMVRARVGRGTFIVDGAAGIEASRRQALLDAALERLLIEAGTLGVPVGELRRRFSRKLDAFQKERARRARPLSDEENRR